MKSGTLFLLLSLAIPSLAFGQLESNTITVFAQRQLSTQSDQAVFNVSLNAAPTKGLDDILAALQGSGISTANFYSLNTQSDGTVQWFFTLPVSLAKIPITAASLVTLQQTIAKSNNGLALNFYVQGLQVSDAVAQSQSCPFAALLSDARAQAQKLAQAAGLTAGPTLTIATGNTPAVVPAAAFLTGDFARFLLSSVPVPPPSSCSLVVKFQLLR